METYTAEPAPHVAASTARSTSVTPGVAGDRLVSMKEGAEMLGYANVVSMHVALTKMRRGEIKSYPLPPRYRVGTRRVFFKYSELIAYINGQREDTITRQPIREAA